MAIGSGSVPSRPRWDEGATPVCLTAEWLLPRVGSQRRAGVTGRGPVSRLKHGDNVMTLIDYIPLRVVDRLPTRIVSRKNGNNGNLIRPAYTLYRFRHRGCS